MGTTQRLEDELEALYRQRFQAFVFTATAYLGDADAAWDVVHDAFAQALRRRRSYRHQGPLEAWVWTIVLNVARDRLRQRARQVVPVAEVAPARTAHSSVEVTDSLRRGVLALPERQRLAVFLRYYADLDYDTIGDLLGISPGTVAASLNAARTTLRSRLKEVPE